MAKSYEGQKDSTLVAQASQEQPESPEESGEDQQAQKIGSGKSQEEASDTDRDLSMDPNRQKKTPAWRKLLTFVLLQIVISTIFFAYVRNFMTQETVIMWLPSTIEPPRNSSLTEKEYVSRTLNPVILLWTWPFGEWFPFQKCSSVLGIPDCHITDNRSWYQKADAIIVHHRDACSSPRELPQDPRPLAQRWIWFSMESPSHSYNLSFMDNLFNLTMSYRRDSDIFTPYGWMEVLPQHQKVTVPSKSKLLAWVVSNW
ncbi:hypothetical protein lerEdw1_020916, partial [Lerista edwardsae]